MGSKVVRVIRPIANAAEKEYIKSFLRFIGCFISDCPVETNIPSNWDRALYPDNEPGGVDIVINYFGEDPYALECRHLNMKRIYCYFDFADKKRWGQVQDSPAPNKEAFLDDTQVKTDGLGSDGAQKTPKKQLRAQVLQALVEHIWDDQDPVRDKVRKLARLYLYNRQGDLFPMLRAEKCLRVLSLGELLKEPSAQVSRIKMDSYVEKILNALWEVKVSLEKENDPYSCYARVKASIIIRNIVRRLYNSELMGLSNISFGEKRFLLPQSDDLRRELWTIVDADPEFLTAYLLPATCFRSSEAAERAAKRVAEMCYQHVLKNIPGNKKLCAFIWYRMGQHYEKTYCDPIQAMSFYRKAVEIDPRAYQAMFKLGYYATFEGRFTEAEMWLEKTIQAIFCGRSTGPSESGEYKNWLSLSLKNSQYVYQSYMLLAKISVNKNREYAARSYIGRVCMAATRFEAATLVRHALDPDEFQVFDDYHRFSTAVWSMWKVLSPWSEDIVRDYYVRDIVRQRLSRWS